MATDQKEADLKPRSYAFARRIIRLYASLPKDTIAQVLGKQVLRSGTSVGANYREAYRGRSKAEFIAKMGDCLRELDETEYWLEPLVDEAIVARAKMEALLRKTRELIAIFVTIINHTRRNRVS
jgi:four helix bundle protein